MYLCPLKMKKQSFYIIFRIWTCLTLWWTVSTTVQAQVQGFVTDSLSRKPVSFVQVYYEGSSIGTRQTNVVIIICQLHHQTKQQH